MKSSLLLFIMQAAACDPAMAQGSFGGTPSNGMFAFLWIADGQKYHLRRCNSKSQELETAFGKAECHPKQFSWQGALWDAPYTMVSIQYLLCFPCSPHETPLGDALFLWDAITRIGFGIILLEG